VTVREVYTNQDFTQVGYYKSILDAAGIVTFIRNESANTAGMSGPMFLPTLCVLQDDDYDEATRILTEQRTPQASGADWICPSCSEKNPANFELCWNCNSARPGI
jgi:hypothetical protein